MILFILLLIINLSEETEEIILDILLKQVSFTDPKCPPNFLSILPVETFQIYTFLLSKY